MTASDDQTIVSWLIVSILVHLLALLFLRLPEAEVRQPISSIEVSLKDPWKSPESMKQIVDVPHFGAEEKPKQAKYLSDRNQRVEKETQSPGKVRQPSRQALHQEAVTEPQESGMGERKPQERAQSGERSIFQGSGGDYLPGVEIGDKTYINAEAFEHTNYYLEIKRKIELAWNPRAILQDLFSRGEVPQRRILTTYLGITLSRQGDLEDILLIRTSGLMRLDAEAKRAFRASAPFTQAPTELLSPDGKLRFEFGFIIYDR